MSASAALASHCYAATYTGPISGGGSVQLDVSADGGSVTRLVADPGPTECGLIPLFVYASPGVIPIADHAFTYASPPWTFSGSFPSEQTAQGTMQYRRETFPACTTASRNWTATTSAPPTPTPTPVPTSAPTPPPPQPPAPPNSIRIRFTNAGAPLTANRRGVVGVKLGTFSRGVRGTVRVRARRHTLGRRTYRATAERPVTVRVRLNAASRRRLARGRTLHVTIVATARAAGTNVRSSFTTTIRR